MFLVELRGQSHRELQSEDWWAQSEQEIHGALGRWGLLQFQRLLGLAL
jgi:hypothetical protein